MAIVVLNAALGFSQEYRAPRGHGRPQETGRADGEGPARWPRGEISARDLVPGDLVLLEAGARVPADGRLLEAPTCGSRRRRSPANRSRSKSARAADRAGPARGRPQEHGLHGHVVTYGRGLVVTETGMAHRAGAHRRPDPGVEREPTPSAAPARSWAGPGPGGDGHRRRGLCPRPGARRGAAPDVPDGHQHGRGRRAGGLPAVVTIALALGAQRMLKRRPSSASCPPWRPSAR
jgi:P-type Ca2+ transporter type 2C